MPDERFKVISNEPSDTARLKPPFLPRAQNHRSKRHILSLHLQRHYALKLRDIRPKRRAPRVVAIKQQVAMYLANTILRMTFDQIGRWFDRDPRTVAYSCRKIEDLRDHVTFDWHLQLNEDILRQELIRSGHRHI